LELNVGVLSQLFKFKFSKLKQVKTSSKSKAPINDFFKLAQSANDKYNSPSIFHIKNKS